MMEAHWKEKIHIPGSQTVMDLSGLSGSNFPTEKYQDNHNSCSVWQIFAHERKAGAEGEREADTSVNYKPRDPDISINDPILK